MWLHLSFLFLCVNLVMMQDFPPIPQEEPNPTYAKDASCRNCPNETCVTGGPDRIIPSKSMCVTVTCPYEGEYRLCGFPVLKEERSCIDGQFPPQELCLRPSHTQNHHTHP